MTHDPKTHKLVSALILEQLEAQDARIIFSYAEFSYAEESGDRYLCITCTEGEKETTLTFPFNVGGDLLSKVLGKLAKIKAAEIGDMIEAISTTRQ